MSDYTDIQPELDDFENAVYGEEVRSSMISAIKKIHDVAESAAGAPDASSATAGQAPIADGAGGWAWGDVATSGDSVPTEVRQAIYNLLAHAIYKDYNPSEDGAVIQSWATEITAITISASSISISGENTYQLTATTSPSGGVVTWSTSDSTVATVSNGGLVTSIGNGTATITASCGGLSATCLVTVTGVATVCAVTNTLTNVTNSNSATTAREGTSYSATLTADSGYSITTITITMGGTDITSTAYSNGTITISEVTGDIAITAVGSVPEYELYIPASNTGIFTTTQGKDVNNKITRIDLDCALPVYNSMAVLLRYGQAWAGVNNGKWDGGLKTSVTPAYSEVAGQGRSIITFETTTDGTYYLALRSWSNNHPEMTIYGIDIYSGDTLQASYKPTSVVGAMYDSVNQATINWTDTTGMVLTEV